MGAIVRWVFPLVAYLCVATVVSAAMGFVYLRQSGTLNDETMFRIMALVHGIDLEELERKGKELDAAEVPPEEPSFVEQQLQRHAATLHFDARQKQLADSLSDFEYQLKRLSEAMARYGTLKADVENFLKQQSDQVLDVNRQKVRQQLEAMDPKKQAKPLLVKMIDADQVDEVIMLLSGMKDRNVREILRKFDTEEDLERLTRIHKLMLSGHPAKSLLDNKMKELEQLKEQDE